MTGRRRGRGRRRRVRLGGGVSTHLGAGIHRIIPLAILRHGQRDKERIDRLIALGSLGLHDQIQAQLQTTEGHVAVRINGLCGALGALGQILLQLGRKGAVGQITQRNAAAVEIAAVFVAQVAVLALYLGHTVQSELAAAQRLIVGAVVQRNADGAGSGIAAAVHQLDVCAGGKGRQRTCYQKAQHQKQGRSVLFEISAFHVFHLL